MQPIDPVLGQLRAITPLSPRERDVAALIAEGLTNAEIAARLAVTTGTVANHIEHIRHKLGARNRVMIAVWAVEARLRSAVPADRQPSRPISAPM